MVCAKGSSIFLFCCKAAPQEAGLGGLRNRKLLPQWKGKEVQTWADRHAFRLYTYSYMAHAFLLTFFLYADYIDREGVKYVEETTVSQSI